MLRLSFRLVRRKFRTIVKHSISNTSNYFSSVPEWNDAVLENGELFFIKCSPFMKEAFIDAADPKHNATFKKRYKLSKFLKKRRFKKQRAGNSRSQNHDENCETPKVNIIVYFCKINRV